ncbi:HsdM family class I SAM-dependent methyltransferase [Paracidovorax oryzae]|uniref:HsdM family class I SAM-dependent methyltransferase n=1 Tax=Paracidovorax oryzae TaxID=862720 RepID=UPI0035CFBD0C
MEERTGTESDDSTRVVEGSASASPKAPSRLSLLRQIRGLKLAGQACNASPSAVVGTAIATWCAADFKALPASGLPYSKSLAATPALQSFVKCVRQLGFLEASYWLSSAYAMLADEMHRKQLAMFFTPASLTRGLLDDLAEQGVEFGSQSFLDPACGGAAFLAPIALRMRDALRSEGIGPKAILQHVESHLYGTDLDGTLCALSAHFLRMALHEEIRASGYVPAFKVHRADSLRELVSMFGQLDVVVCNPPYRKMGGDELVPLRDQYGEVIESQPNLYGLFIALSVRLLREGGRAALVTPTSFLSGQYFSALRRFLSRNTVIEHIGMVSDRLGVFIDVEQETALTVLRRSVPAAAPEAWADVSVVSATGKYQSVGKCRLPHSGEVWPIPRGVDDVTLLHTAGKSTFRLSHYGYRVRIGAFVWNRDKRPTFQCARDVKRARCRTAVPLLWSADISLDGQLQFDGATAKADEHRFVDLGSREHTSVVTQPGVVLQRVTSNTQARRLVAAAVPRRLFEEYGGFVGENHLVVLEPAVESPVLTAEELASLLAVPAVDRFFRCISGATNVSAFELGQLALPDPHRLKALLKSGLPMQQAVHLAYAA